MPKKWPDRPQLTTDRVIALAAAARLDLDAQRALVLVGQMEQVAALLDGLDQVDLGETVPAIAYPVAWDS